MKHYLLLLLPAILFLACSQENRDNTESQELITIEKKLATSADKDLVLVCLDEGDKITCKVMTKRVNEDRGVRFNWQSPASSEDNKVRTLTLPSNHASIYDTRDKEGRAKGTWKVTAVIGDDEVSTTFQIQ